MNLDQLEVINAIVEKGSFRAAAEHLHRSQPALSTSIKNLEEEFGILIFDRNEYRPKLTEAGAVFLKAARTALDAANQAARIGIELGKNKAETKLRISVDPLVSLEVLEVIAQECAKPTIPVNLIMERTILGGATEALLSEDVDLALAPDTGSNNSKIEKIVIESVSLVGVISKKLLEGKTKATSGLLKKHAQVVVYDKDLKQKTEDLPIKTLLDGGGYKIFAPDHFTKLRLIEKGVGWGRVAKTEFENTKGLISIEKNLCEPLSLELCLMRSKHRPIGPTARKIWKLFEERTT